MTMKVIYRQLIWVTIFSIAMGFLETSVVVYLRELYYPEGFSFPMKPIAGNIGLTELLREAATIIMLTGIAILTGKTKLQKFAYFLYSFAIWDIFYYVFLKMLLGWPESILTWDILFLIPVTWVGPVLAPLICSITMIFFAFLILYYERGNAIVRIAPLQWGFLITGSLVVIFSFIRDYILFMSSDFSFIDLLTPSLSDEIMVKGLQYIPVHFDWWIFILGEVIILTGIFLFAIKSKNKRSA